MRGITRFYVERDVRTGAWNVYAWQRYADGQAITLQLDALTGGFDEVGNALDGAQPERPSAILPDELVDALVEAVKGVKPGEVLADSVADARKTRDEVLRLHERTVDFIMRTATRDFSS